MTFVQVHGIRCVMAQIHTTNLSVWRPGDGRYILPTCLLPHCPNNQLGAPCLLPLCPSNQLGAPCLLPQCPSNQLGAPCLLPQCPSNQLGAPCLLPQCPSNQLGASCLLPQCPSNQLGAPTVVFIRVQLGFTTRLLSASMCNVYIIKPNPNRQFKSEVNRLGLHI